MFPMFTVIIMAYNAEAFIDKCLLSLIHQSIGIHNLEVLVMDDASSDSTPRILKHYHDMYPDSIKPVFSKVNSRTEKVVNRDIGVRLAKGEHILFLDQDDWLEPHALQLLHGYLQEHPQLDYIEFAFHTLCQNNTTLSSMKHKGFQLYHIGDEQQRNDLFLKRILPGYAPVWNKVYRRQFLIDNHIVHNCGDKWAAFSDNFFSALLVLHSRFFATLDIPLYNYLLHPDNASKKASVQFQRCMTGLFFYEEALLRGLYSRNKLAVEYLFFKIFLLKTFWKFLLQFDQVQFQQLYFIQDNIRNLLPDYRLNPLLSHHQEMADIFPILDMDWTDSFLLDLRTHTLHHLQLKDPDKQLYLVSGFKPHC